MNKGEFDDILAKYFKEDYGIFEIQPFGAGLIHGTYLIEVDTYKYILQEFNLSVFNHPERITHNQQLIKSQANSNLLPFDLPLPISNLEGKLITESNGKLFRLFDFVEGQTIQHISVLDQAYLAAKAYGIFAGWGQVVSTNDLQECIPDFHRLDLRFERFLEAAEDASKLSEEENEVLEFYSSQKSLVDQYVALQKSLPQHLTHNDTKINNLIFSKDLQKVKALVDLDTLMPGYLLYDFGDLVRTVACSESEISIHWESIRFEITVFEELLKGYFEGIKNFATKKEIESLLIGGDVMICIMGLRFFTDHLRGNVYYKVQYPEQNLHRAKNQMLLLKSLEESKSQIHQIWENITSPNA